jgi:hypothetical protein
MLCRQLCYAGNNDDNDRPSHSISQRPGIDPDFNPDGGC